MSSEIHNNVYNIIIESLKHVQCMWFSDNIITVTVLIISCAVSEYECY